MGAAAGQCLTMLPSDLLMHRHSGETLIPKRLPLEQGYGVIATELITLFRDAQGSTRGEVNRQLL